MRKPLIGLAGISATNSVNGTELAAVNRAYVEAVVGAGGVPLVLPIQEAADARSVLSAVDGLLLCGGIDIDPAVYGALRGPDIDEIDRSRDGWELALADTARLAEIPLLGVCRGAQLLNVSAGGSLVQDVPTVTGMDHRDTPRSRDVAHQVWLEPDSAVAEVCGRLNFGVNTLHHQAVDRTGAGLRPVAWATDGTIEAIESTTTWSAIGVQWHPELLVSHQVADVAQPHCGLFRWLVVAATGRRMHVVPSQVGTEPTLERQAS